MNPEEIRAFEHEFGITLGGVTIHLLRQILSWLEVDGHLDYTTGEVVFNYVKPLTSNTQNSFFNFLQAGGSVPRLSGNFLTLCQEKAKAFTSHAWRYKFVDLVEGIEQFFLKNADEYHPDTCGFWIDAFVNNQWTSIQRDFQSWTTLFTTAIRLIGHTVMVLAPWHDPIPLERSWCIFEVFATCSQNIRFSIQLTNNHMQLSGNRTLYWKHIDAEKAEASSKPDETAILEILRSYGIQHVNVLVRNAIMVELISFGFIEDTSGVIPLPNNPNAALLCIRKISSNENEQNLIHFVRSSTFSFGVHLA